MSLRLVASFAAGSVLALSCAAPVPMAQAPPPPDGPLAQYAHPFPAFSVSYPQHWNVTDPQGRNGVFRAIGPQRLPVLAVSVIDRPQQISLGQTTTRLLVPLLTAAGGYVEVVSDQEATLRDGKRAREALLRTTFSSGTQLDMLSLSIFMGSRWIMVTVSGLALGDAAHEQLRRIAYTLRVE